MRLTTLHKQLLRIGWRCWRISWRWWICKGRRWRISWLICRSWRQWRISRSSGRFFCRWYGCRWYGRVGRGRYGCIGRRLWRKCFRMYEGLRWLYLWLRCCGTIQSLTVRVGSIYQMVTIVIAGIITIFPASITGVWPCRWHIPDDDRIKANQRLGIIQRFDK